MIARLEVKRIVVTVLAAALMTATLGGCGAERDDSSQAAGIPGAEDCPVLPKSSLWNRRVDDLPVLGQSAQIVGSIGAEESTHADFGSGVYEGKPLGIPYVTVSSDAEPVPVSFEEAPEESDPGPYPVPPDAPIEGGPDGDGDRHVITLDRSSCKLYELFAAYPEDGGRSWRAGSGAVWDLRTNRPRPEGWTSADAAGLPILPGLARPEEVRKGQIALRITVPRSRQEYIYPASHFASEETVSNLPAMGERLRIKRDFDTSGFPPQSRVLLQALQRYGAIVADNGSPWFISGVPSDAWNNDDLSSLAEVPGSAWEVVDTTGMSKPRE